MSLGMDLGPHAGFIWAAYGATLLVLVGLLAWLGRQGESYRRRLTELEAQGLRRRSAKED